MALFQKVLKEFRGNKTASLDLELMKPYYIGRDSFRKKLSTTKS